MSSRLSIIIIISLMLTSCCRSQPQTCTMLKPAVLQERPGVAIADGLDGHALIGKGMTLTILDEEQVCDKSGGNCVLFYIVRLPPDYGGYEGYIPADRCSIAVP